MDQDLSKDSLEKCPYCSSIRIKFLLKSKDYLTHKKGEFYLSKCLDCGLVFQNPRVKEKDISYFYDKSLGYYNFVEKKEFSFFKKEILRNHFNYGKKDIWFFFTLLLKKFFLSKSYPVFKENGELLEIGCSHGAFLEELKELGWQVKGIEMDQDSCLFAQEKRGLDVVCSKIEDVEFEEQFDVVVMNMVLEHLFHPFAFLKKIDSLLKKEGQLIFSIPYFNGFEFKWFKEYCYGLQLPTHITFFNKKILKECLTNLGFTEIKFYHQMFDRDIVVSSQYKGFNLIGYNRVVRTLLVKPFVFLLYFFKKTSRITVRARKI